MLNEMYEELVMRYNQSSDHTVYQGGLSYAGKSNLVDGSEDGSIR